MNTLNQNFHLVTISYDRDLEWLKYCICSIDRFCKGYSGHTILLDNHKKDCIKTKSFLKTIKQINTQIVYGAEGIEHGYVRQQYMKFLCDLYVPRETDWIIHIDSDSVFFEYHTPEIYFDKNENKPIMLMTTYEELKKHGVPWQSITEEFMQDTVRYEFMRRMPLIYPKWIFKEIRNWIETTHKQTIGSYLSRMQTFSEYNAIGAYLYKYHRDEYLWIDTRTQPYDSLPMLQNRSYDGFDIQNPIPKSLFLRSLILNPEKHLVLKDILKLLNSQNVHLFGESNKIDYRIKATRDLYNILIKEK